MITYNQSHTGTPCTGANGNTGRYISYGNPNLYVNFVDFKKEN